MLWQNYKLFLNKRYIMPGKTQYHIPAKAYQKVSYVDQPGLEIC